MSTEQDGHLFIWLKVIWVLAYSQSQPLSKTPGWWVDPLASPWWPCYPSTACTCLSSVQKFASYERVISTWLWITHKLSKRLVWLGLRKRPNTPNSQGMAGRFIQITESFKVSREKFSSIYIIQEDHQNIPFYQRSGLLFRFHSLCWKLFAPGTFVSPQEKRNIECN